MSTSENEQDQIDVAVMMGSKSDLETMRPAAKAAERLGLKVEVRVLSAHRTPEEAAKFVKDAVRRGAVAQQHAVPQGRADQRADVGRGGVGPPFEERPRLGPEDQRLRRPQPRVAGAREAGVFFQRQHSHFGKIARHHGQRRIGRSVIH